MILAKSAEPKSREKWWIFYFNDFLIKFMIQFTMSCSIKVGITVSFTEHFWSKARQNLWMTEPLSCSFNILIRDDIPWWLDWWRPCSFCMWCIQLPSKCCKRCWLREWWRILALGFGNQAGKAKNRTFQFNLS